MARKGYPAEFRRRVLDLVEAGRNVVEGDLSDPEFVARMNDDHRIELVLLATGRAVRISPVFATTSDNRRLCHLEDDGVSLSLSPDSGEAGFIDFGSLFSSTRAA
jgi:hypothetical protein